MLLPFKLIPMMQGLAQIGLVQFASQLITFNPLSLFAAGEQGAIYDPSDLSTLFQDAAGTTPVTATGQPVGLMLDKSGRGNHATQPTAGFRPIYRDVGGLRYLAFDGIDDCLFTGNIDFTGTDKVSVFAGVRKLGDVTAALVELSASSTSNNSTFAIFAPISAVANATYTFRSRGTVISEAQSAMSFQAPNSAVLSAKAEIGTDTSILRANGAQTGSSVTDQGTGNYGNYPIYIGRRGGTSLPFNGHLYGLIIRGALTDDPTTIKVEQLLAAKTGVTF